MDDSTAHPGNRNEEVLLDTITVRTDGQTPVPLLVVTHTFTRRVSLILVPTKTRIMSAIFGNAFAPATSIFRHARSWRGDPLPDIETLRYFTADRTRRSITLPSPSPIAAWATDGRRALAALTCAVDDVGTYTATFLRLFDIARLAESVGMCLYLDRLPPTIRQRVTSLPVLPASLIDLCRTVMEMVEEEAVTPPPPSP